MRRILRESLKDRDLYGEVCRGIRRILEPAKTAGLTPDDVQTIRAFRTAVISIMVESARDTFIDNYVPIMEGQFTQELLDVSRVAALREVLKKKIGREHVYRSEETLKLELMGRRVIRDLLDVFWEGAREYQVGKLSPKNFPGKAAALLSSNYRDVFDNEVKATTPRLPEAYFRLQLVTDYVCGMTDTFATDLHRQLVNG